MTVLALEIGATRIAAGRIADEGPEEMRQIPTPATAVWEHCRELLSEIAGPQTVRAVGIGAAGPIDMAAGIVASAAIPEWRAGFAIGAAIQELFPSAKTVLVLDGICHAMAENNFGETQEVMDSLVINASSRVTGGVTVGGLVMVGRTGNAGHIGHVLVPGYDTACECGGHGCLEAVASGHALVRWARARGWAGSSEQVLVDAARAGEDIAVAALDRAGTALGRAIVSVAALNDIDRVVVGGTLADAGPPLWTPLGRAVSDHARLGFLTGLRVVPSRLGEDGILLGAGLFGVVATR